MILRSVLALFCIISGASGWIYFLYYLSGPDERLKFPRDLLHLTELKGVLEDYARTKGPYTLIFFSSVYLYKQSFAIPGSVLLNLLSGALFGVWGFFLCSFLSAVGASFCYTLSKFFGKAILIRYAPARIAYFQQMVEKSREEKGLFRFLVSLRIFPMTPNWLINMASPIVGVPLRPFFLSCLLGLAPYNFLTCNAGSALAELKSIDDVISWRVGLSLAFLAIAILNPVKLTKRVLKRFNSSTS